MRKQQGFTLVEVTIILLVLTILSTIMLPQLGNFNRLARFVKAREDVGAICSSLKKMLDEVFQGAVFKEPKGNNMPFGILYGPGSVPAPGGASSGAGNAVANPSDCSWRDSASAADGGIDISAAGCQERLDSNNETGVFFASRLENHLIHNDPDGDGSPADATDYPNPVDDPDEHAHGSTGVGGYFGWRGPYLDWLSHDPWGNRYAVNTFALYSPLPGVNMASNDNIYSSAVVCYSAGADERVDTYFNQPAGGGQILTGGGWVWGKDDIGAILSAGGPF